MHGHNVRWPGLESTSHLGGAGRLRGWEVSGQGSVNSGGGNSHACRRLGIARGNDQTETIAGPEIRAGRSVGSGQDMWCRRGAWLPMLWGLGRGNGC